MIDREPFNTVKAMNYSFATRRLLVKLGLIWKPSRSTNAVRKTTLPLSVSGDKFFNDWKLLNG